MCGLASLLCTACTEPDFVDALEVDERKLQGEAAIDGSVPIALLADAASLDAGAPDPRAVTIVRPDGAYAVELTADGTGCPAGTWSLGFGRDGKQLELSTWSFDMEVSPRTPVSVKSCQLRYRLRSAAATTFALRSVRFPSYGYLEAGVKARFSIEHRFAEHPPVQTRADFEGPVDDIVAATYEADESALSWSPCGTVHDLLMSHTARLENSDPPRTGYLSVSGIDPSSHPPTLIALEQRPCEI